MTFTYPIPSYRTEGAEVQDMDLPKMYSLHLEKAATGVIMPDFSPPLENSPDPEKYGWIYVVGGKGGVVQYVGMSAQPNISDRINRTTISKYRWASDDFYYEKGKSEFKVAVWAVPFKDARDLEGIEVDVAAFYRVLVGAWPVSQIDISATSVLTINSSMETWRYAVAIIEDMNQHLTVRGSPFLPFLDEDEDRRTLAAIVQRSKIVHSRGYTRPQLWKATGQK